MPPDVGQATSLTRRQTLHRPQQCVWLARRAGCPPYGWVYDSEYEDCAKGSLDGTTIRHRATAPPRPVGSSPRRIVVPPSLGTFLSPDTIVPDAGAVIDYNRFLYARGNPLRYNDPDGHCPVCIVVGAVVLLKAIDYGWTAYDAWQAGKVLADPASTVEEKTAASLELATIAAAEALEPDDLLPVSLPLDDLARKGVLKLGREATQEGAEKTAKQVVDDLYGPFYRLESPSQTSEIAAMQEVSGEIWGKAPRGSDIPKVQAYRGSLPEGARGIEFYTPVEPDAGVPPHRANWSGPRPGVRVEEGYAKICCTITQNTQR